MRVIVKTVLLVIGFVQTLSAAPGPAAPDSASPQQAAPSSSSDEFIHWKTLAVENFRWSKQFELAATHAMRLILDAGQPRIGAFDLAELREQIRSVRWMILEDQPIAAGPDGNRSSATYSVKENLVIVSLNEWAKMDPAVQNAFACHEALGALGYRDENYTLCVSLGATAAIVEAKKFSFLPDSQTVLSRLPDLDLKVSRTRSLDDNSRTTVTPTFTLPVPMDGANIASLAGAGGGSGGGNGGGITGIGGGGDFRALTLKLAVSLIFPVLWQTPEFSPKGISFDEAFSIVLNSQFERTRFDAYGGQAIIDNTKVKLSNGSLSVVVPRNEAITQIRTREGGRLYFNYLCGEIMTAFVADGQARLSALPARSSNGRRP